MPIRPDQAHRYPPEWKVISTWIRFVRAMGRCECTGQCGSSHFEGIADDARCSARHGQPAPISGKTVVLTTAHLNHTPEDCRPENLMAMCQRCHLAYDADLHAATRAANRRAEAEAAGQQTLELPHADTR